MMCVFSLKRNFVMSKQSFNAESARRVRSTIDFKLLRSDCEKSGGDSVTSQEKTLTIREIYDRYVNGVAPDDMKNPVFGEADAEFDMPDLEKVNQLDLFDRQELAREYGELLDRRIAIAKEVKVARDKAQEEASKDEGDYEPDYGQEKREKPGKGVSHSSRYEKTPKGKSNESDQSIDDQD